MKIDDAFGNRQTDTGSKRTAFGGVFNLVKGLEDFFQIFGFYSDAVVGNLHQQVGVLDSATEW